MMQARTVRSRAGGAARLLAALLALAAPPSLLAFVVGNPLPAWPIDWALVVESVQAGLVPSSVWVDVLAVVAWIAWAVLVAMLTAEVIAVARHRPSAPVVPGWIRHLAQLLVAAAVALAGPGQHAVSGASPGAAFVAAAAPVDDGGQVEPVEAEPTVEGRMVTVGEGDSWSGFTADVVGDASLGPQLREANLGRRVGAGQTVSEATAFVEPGWQLLIPADLDRHAPVERATGPTMVNEEAEASSTGTWDVEKGDHFWSIAEQALTDAWDREPTDAEIAPYWRELVENNRDRLLPPKDPDLIYPGQEFVIPDPPTDPDATTESADGAASVEDGWRAAIEDADALGGPEPEVTTPDRDAWRRAIETPATDGEVVEGEERAELDGEERTAWGIPGGLSAGVAAATLLAAGVAATLRWRRRTALQQRLPGLRLPTPLPDVEEESARLEAAAAPESTLDDLAAMLASIPPYTHPALVTAMDDGEITLLFDEQDELPDPPAPWTLAYDGSEGPVGWRAALGSRGPERSVGLPLLVTLGRTGMTNVFANVGAMGTLALAGDEAEVRRRLRTMSLEVATSRIAVPVEVAVAGDDRMDTLDHVRHIDDPAQEVRLSVEEVDEDIVLDDRTPRLLVCHRDAHQPDVPNKLRGMVGVVTAGRSPEAWLVDIDDGKTGRLHLPGGGTVTLVLPDVDADVIDDELTRLDQPATEPVNQPTGPAMAADPSSNGHPPTATKTGIEPAWCEVRVLGPVEVVIDGQRVQLSTLLLEVFTYLAVHDGVSKERLDAAVWAGDDAPLSTQRVKSALNKIRAAIGDGPDGKPLLPTRGADEPIELSEHVGSDLDRALAHLELARDLPAEPAAREVATALDLVRGEPFQGRTYSWTTEPSQQAIVNLQDAAVEAAQTLRKAGELDAAASVIQQAHKLLAGNGWLYLEQAEIETARGHPERASMIYEQYRRTLGDDADEVAGTVASPPPEIELAFSELVGTP